MEWPLAAREATIVEQLTVVAVVDQIAAVVHQIAAVVDEIVVDEIAALCVDSKNPL